MKLLVLVPLDGCGGRSVSFQLGFVTAVSKIQEMLITSFVLSIVAVVRGFFLCVCCHGESVATLRSCSLRAASAFSIRLKSRVSTWRHLH